MKKAVVTGASGFVGSHLVKELVNNSYEVLAVVRPNTKNLGRIENTPNVTIVECELLELEKLKKIDNESYDYFFHLGWAGVSGLGMADYELQICNVKASIKAIEAAKIMGCKRFIGAGSLHEAECQKELVLPLEVTNQGNAYKIAKLAAHYYCKLRASALQIEFIWPILTNAYGSGENSGRFINYFIQTLLKNQEPELTKADQLYNFIYITDAVRAFRMIAEKGISFQSYIIGTEDVRPLKEFLLEAQNLINSAVPLGFGKKTFSGVYLDKKDLYCDRLFQEIGFRTEVPFWRGIEKTVKWLEHSLP